MLSLEQIDVVFRQSTQEFWSWAWNEEASWFLNRVKFWRRATREQRPQLYDWLALEQPNEPTELRNGASSIEDGHLRSRRGRNGTQGSGDHPKAFV